VNEGFGRFDGAGKLSRQVVVTLRIAAYALHNAECLVRKFCEERELIQLLQLGGTIRKLNQQAYILPVREAPLRMALDCGHESCGLWR
jgi:RNase P/RNase MRP subunit POP5